MVDIFTKEKRSWIMSRIRSKNTKIDLQMDSMLFSIGCTYEKYPKVFGNPDFVIDEKIAIFCDGDFWHGYQFSKTKGSLNRFWKNKIEQNMRRDVVVSRRLRMEGYSVLRFWEHDMKKRTSFCREKIMRKIRERNLPLKHKRK